MNNLSRVLQLYNQENPGIKAKLFTLLSSGATAHSGYMMVYAVDQGFEHGPVKSFSSYPESLCPLYHFRLAHEGGASALAAPIGFLEQGALEYAGKLPLILKMNSSNSLQPLPHDQAITARVEDALRLGCIGIGFTIYPGAPTFLKMLEELKDISAQAKASGLLVVVWSYPRGPGIAPEHETALETIAYGAHMAALMGAHIIKVKMPVCIKDPESFMAIDVSSVRQKVLYVLKAGFDKKRLVLFSGGETKDTSVFLQEVQSIKDANGAGSIVGRNLFQRSYEDALSLMKQSASIYQS